MFFSEDWMVEFGEKWNSDPELGEALSQIGFNTVIGYGFDGDPQATGVLVIKDGYATEAGAYNGEELNWDLRASAADWEKWSKKPPGMMALGMAYTTRKLKFVTGDYAAMIKDPRMAGPFIKSFAVMGQVEQ